MSQEALTPQRKFSNPYSSSNRGRGRVSAIPARGTGPGGRSGGTGISAYFSVGPGRSDTDCHADCTMCR